MATVFIIAMTIALVTSLFLFQKITNHLISEAEAKIDISVYFNEDASEQDILGIRKELLKFSSEIKDMEYVSKEEALEKFIQVHKDNPDYMESLQILKKNPFPASLNIRAFEASQYEAIANFLQDSSFKGLIEKVDYPPRKQIIERLFSITSGVNKAFIIFSFIAGFIAVLVTFNTVRLAIYNSKQEIFIMRLVGASNWFIRGPFLIQGAISGILAVLICLLVFSVGLYFLSPKFESLLFGFNLFDYFKNNFLIIVLIQSLTGIGLGVISSYITIRKYLKV